MKNYMLSAVAVAFISLGTAGLAYQREIAQFLRHHIGADLGPTPTAKQHKAKDEHWLRVPLASEYAQAHTNVQHTQPDRHISAIPNHDSLNDNADNER